MLLIFSLKEKRKLGFPLLITINYNEKQTKCCTFYFSSEVEKGKRQGFNYTNN